MAKISPSILSLEFFCKNSIYLRVRLCERFVNPQLLKQLAVYKIKNFYNEMRPCYALGYDIPNHYEQRYWNGELEKKDTFRNRVLSETPKFVQKKMSTCKN